MRQTTPKIVLDKAKEVTVRHDKSSVEVSKVQVCIWQIKTKLCILDIYFKRADSKNGNITCTINKFPLDCKI